MRRFIKWMIIPLLIMIITLFWIEGRKQKEMDFLVKSENSLNIAQKRAENIVSIKKRRAWYYTSKFLMNFNENLSVTVTSFLGEIEKLTGGIVSIEKLEITPGAGVANFEIILRSPSAENGVLKFKNILERLEYVSFISYTKYNRMETRDSDLFKVEGELMSE